MCDEGILPTSTHILMISLIKSPLNTENTKW